ncbi:hypothetical protein [Pseudomonas gingeri]|uniref:hypothetical protein n=1 Tax=Pseudomonas gingeri TaxID=117681 RepID=UPI0015A267AC|nr:hypothetical protein [Pseudomonas gingeri]NWA03748.1 hypothetical protein [Pseudomonas gingeri]NWA14607.1 hypothetical protein [Pseudomonas gingeri]NWA58735.1 hypothetical protein [Pseudomonas gingeri]NWA94499.1 hypothetical protein [Pseudomonas gingeri]NWB01155.1 hypothetical protein [Pseudomonas gingeri]
MSRAHTIAVGMIDARFDCLRNGDSSAQLFAETSMAFEMAHALGAIDDIEFGTYKARFNRFYEIQAEAFAADIRRTAP